MDGSEGDAAVAPTAAGRLVLAVFCASLLGPLASTAWPHARSVSYSFWEIDERGAAIEVRIPLLELTRFAEGGAPPSYFPSALELSRADVACSASDEARAERAGGGWVVFRWKVACSGGGRWSIRSRLLLEVAPSHLHFVRVRVDGRILERVLAASEPSWDLPTPAEAAPGVSRFVLLGIEHISSGFDHLAFVAALLLLATRFFEVATLVTGFTVGHSVTLALAVTGNVRPEAGLVEILIGFSLLLVAAENLWMLAGRDRAIAAAFVGLIAVGGALSIAGIGALPPLAWTGLALFSVCHFGLLSDGRASARVRAGVALAFGLVHGLGFAGVLMEMELPPERLLPALVAFNVGVEIGQFVFVLAAWPLLAWLAARRRPWRLRLAETGSAFVLGLGLYWVIVRSA